MLKYKKNIVPFIVSLFSIWTLINVTNRHFDPYSYISIIVGFMGVILYYTKNEMYDKLFYLWFILQIPNISYSELNIMSSFPLNISLGFGLGLKNKNSLNLYFNVLPIGLYYLSKRLNKNS